MNWINWLWKWIPWFKKNQDKLPDVVKPKEENKGCGCELGGVVIRPLQFMGSFSDTDKTLAEGNFECGGYPLDIRCCLMRSDGKAWIYKNYVGNAVTLLSDNTFKCTCFDNPNSPDSRFHFLGWSQSDLPKDIIKADAGDVLTYTGTCFIYYELRLK